MTSKPGAVLAIADTAYGEGAGWRKGQDLIDALPYIDDPSPELRKQVELLINEEMERSTKKPQDYLKDIPAPGAMFENRPLLAAEYERVKQHMPMPPLDVTRYRLEPPPQSKRNDFNAWRAAVDNAHSQLEHQYLRIVNLELMLKHGSNVWRAKNQLTGNTNKRLEHDLKELKALTEKVNQERKLQQMNAGKELGGLQGEWMELVHKNAAIERACIQLEGQIGRLSGELEARTPAPPAAGGGENGTNAGETNGPPAAAAAAANGVAPDSNGAPAAAGGSGEDAAGTEPGAEDGDAQPMEQ